jgi:hypothetical protein
VLAAVVMLTAFPGCFPELPPGAEDTERETDGQTADGTDSDDVMPDTAKVDADTAAPQLPPPAEVSASSEFENRIVVTWTAVEGAVAYDVYRDGAVLARVEGGTTVRYEDRTAALAVSNGWTQPNGVTASTDDPDAVRLNWNPPPRPMGPVAVYAVVALGDRGLVSEVSESAEGRRVAPPITAWDIERVVGDGMAGQLSHDVSTTGWEDLDVPAPSIAVPTPNASDEQHRAFVRLQAASETVTRVSVRYRVRGRLEGGGVTPWSEPATGWRSDDMAGAGWEWADTLDGPWQSLNDSAGASYHDETAPADGRSRFYRRRVELDGGSATFSEPTSGRRLAFKDVVCGVDYTCAVTGGSRVWCWGSNARGELGRAEESANTSTPAPVEGLGEVTSIAAGAIPTLSGPVGFTCVTTPESGVWCWGSVMGTSGTSRPVQIEGTESAGHVFAGGAQACITDSDGIRCWGAFLGNSEITSSALPVDTEILSQFTGTPVPLTVFADVAMGGGLGGCAARGSDRQTIACWPGPDQVAAYFDVGTNVSALWRGSNAAHRCAITTSGSVRCWGEGSSGQLGQGEKASSDSPVTVLGLEDSPVVEVSVGSSHTCARQVSGSVRCWGNGTFGQLGHGQSGEGVEALAPVNVADSSGMTHVTAGSYATCAIKDHQVYCWGSNEYGQLGTGDTAPRNVPTPILTP